ncbi:MAG: hypothetical protein WD696_20130 [Bryobacteraceae bacterium]
MGLLLLLLLSASLLVMGQTATGEMQRAVEEFKTQTRNLGLRSDSPKKRSNGGPARAWHGRLFENFRNNVLDAIPHEIRQRGGSQNILRRNQFGFNVGGPLVVPRIYDGGQNTWFSVSYEGVRENISRTYLRTIPTTGERSGDFNHVVDQAGQILPIFDPASTRRNRAYNPGLPVSTANLEYLRDPFPGNRIPTHRLDPVTKQALPLYPEPNTDVGPFFRNNYFINSPESNTANGMIAKIDHSVGDRHRLTFETAFSNGALGSARWFPNHANPGPVDRLFASRRGSLDHVFTYSAGTINTLSFSGSSSTSSNPEIEPFPVYSISPYLSMGRSWPVSKNASNTFVWSDALSTRRGKHSLRFVLQHARYQINTFWPQYPAGSYRFSEGLTSLPGVINTGHAFATFLLGMPNFVELSVVNSPSYFRRTSSRLAIRDQYEAAAGLTINFGLNIDRQTPRTEKFDRISTIDLDAINSANGRKGALVAAARNGQGRSFQPVTIRVEPSLGIAWNPRADPKTVIRLNYDRSYGAIPIYTGQWGTQGFNAYRTFISPNPQLEPALLLRDGIPPSQDPSPDLRPEAANNTIADLVNRDDRLPTYQSASLSVERQLPGSMIVTLSASYAGGKNLLVSNGSANPNAIPLDALAYRDLLNDELFNRSLRPYPQYRGFDVYSAWPLGRYHRDVASVRVEKRASRGISFSASYQFSKQMDDYSGPYGRQDYYSRENEWSLTPGNEPHRLQFSYVYELPLGSNKALLDFEDWRRHLADGWSVTGTGIVQSGGPIYLRPQFNNTGNVVQNLNVNVVPGVNPHVVSQSPSLWFNPEAFDQPPDFTIGNASRTHPSLLGPGSQNYDITLNKRFQLAVDRALEFSAAGFNFINRGNWTDPDNIIGPKHAPNVNAGKIIGSRGGRVIQLGLRFSF